MAGAGGADGREIGRKMGRAMIGAMTSWFGSQKLVLFVAAAKQEDLVALARLLESGKVRPVIDRRYRLSDASHAMLHLAEGHARGKIVVTID